MKKVLAVIMMLVLGLGLIGCGASKPGKRFFDNHERRER